MSEKEMDSYRFGYNVEPTDEMLAQIMKEVAEEARESNKRALDELFEKLRQDVEEDARMMTEPITCSIGEEKPELIIIAGTNGAGKTFITQKFLHNESNKTTAYININEVAYEMFGDWNSIDSIIKAANYCAEWRERCIEEKQSFVFETVMSSEDKIKFITKAKEEGFFVRLFFISTSNPAINASRIAGRVMKGGHDVPITKIISRYFKSIRNCKNLSKIVDRLYIYDNSIDGEDAKIQFRLSNGNLEKVYVENIPEWAQILIPNK
jgi:predicted ABC-type ATPase